MRRVFYVGGRSVNPFTSQQCFRDGLVPQNFFFTSNVCLITEKKSLKKISLGKKIACHYNQLMNNYA